MHVPSPWKMRPALLACAAASILCVLAARSWPGELARHGRVDAALRELRETEWALGQAEPYRSEALDELSRISDNLCELAPETGVDDPDSFAQEVCSYSEAIARMRASASIREADLWDLHLRSGRLARTVDAALLDAIAEASHWRLGLLAFAVLLMGNFVVSLRQLGRASREMNLANAGLEDRVSERTCELERRNAELAVALGAGEEARTQAQRAQALAEEASRLKSGFLANMSHEIRTPMTAILGFAEQLLDPALGESDRVESIGMIRRNGDLLIQLIDDILDISKIEAGHLEVNSAPCSLSAVLAEVRAVMATRAARKGLEFRIDLPHPVPETIVTDALRLKQVLLNLVGNAIKFTENGFVRVTLSCVDVREGLAHLAFRVEDTGIGMDEEALNRLYRPFTQADSSTTRRFGGTGLGLSISMHLAQRLGGGIEAQSRPGMGSTFTLEIRAALAEGCVWRGAEVLETSTVRLSDTRFVTREPELRARILLAEDGVDNRRLIAHLLRRTGAELVAVENGAEAVQCLLEQRDRGRPFDLVLMDMQMPVLDGYSATRALRELGVRTPIVALTANAMTPDRARCFEAGCDEFCAKPVDFEQFYATLRRLLGRSLEQTPAALPRASSTPSGSKHGVDDEAWAELVSLFVSELEDELDGLRSALVRGDCTELQRRAHQLKGSCGSYGFPELGQRASELERCARAGSNPAALEAAFAAFAASCVAAQSSSRV